MAARMILGVSPSKAITSTGTMAIGGSAKRATLMPRASLALTGTRVKSRAAAIAIRLPMAKPAKAAWSVAQTCRG